MVVRRSLQPSGAFEGPKTKASRRTVDVGPATVEALRAHRLRITEAAGIPRATDLVFPSLTGTPLNQRNLRRRLHRLCVSAAVRILSPYSLRHTHAVLAAEGGVTLKTISERMGHASVRTTADVYLHLTPTTARAAAEAVDTILSSRGGP